MDMRLGDPDAELMLRVKAGEEEAFDQLLEKFQRPVINYIYRFVHNRDLAEEIAQEVFLRVYMARRRYQPTAKFSTWLFKIATNLCFKEAARRRMATVEVSMEQEGRDFKQLEDGRPGPLEILDGQEREKLVARAIQSLSANERAAVILRKYQGLSYKEIAESLGCTEAAVKTYLHRAKLRLRDKLARYAVGPAESGGGKR